MPPTGPKWESMRSFNLQDLETLERQLIGDDKRPSGLQRPAAFPVLWSADGAAKARAPARRWSCSPPANRPGTIAGRRQAGHLSPGGLSRLRRGVRRGRAHADHRRRLVRGLAGRISFAASTPSRGLRDGCDRRHFRERLSGPDRVGMRAGLPFLAGRGKRSSRFVGSSASSRLSPGSSAARQRGDRRGAPVAGGPRGAAAALVPVAPLCPSTVAWTMVRRAEVTQRRFDRRSTRRGGPAS